MTDPAPFPVLADTFLPSITDFPHVFPNLPSRAHDSTDDIRLLGLLAPYLRKTSRATGEHWLWSGPIHPQHHTPMLWRYQRRKNVSVIRLLWNLFRAPDAQLGPRERLRRLGEVCTYDRPEVGICVCPEHFTRAFVPTQAADLPDYLVEPQGRARLRWSDWLADRFIYRGEDRLCPDCRRRDVICPAGHIIEADWTRDDDERYRRLGRQVRCPVCTRLRNQIVRDLRGSKPRAGFRPPSAAHNNLSRELADTMRMLPTSEYEGSFERELDEVEAEISELSEPDE